MIERQIVALGGGGFSMEKRPHLDDFVLNLARRHGKPRICFIATASGDNDFYIRRFYESFPPSRAAATCLRLYERTVNDLRAFVLEQDVIYVGGGATANLLAVWRVHRLDRALRDAWRRGVVMAGVSAGAICWFEDGITDSFGMPFRALNDGLGFLRGGFCPHYDGESARQRILRRLVRRGLPSTFAADDGAALHFVGTRLKEVVSSRPDARARIVHLRRGKVVEDEFKVRYLGTGSSARAKS